MVVEGVSPNYAEYESDERPVLLTEREKNLRLRAILGLLTLGLIIAGPVLQFYYEDIFLYILAAGIAFTIGTNLTIAVLSIRIEDKAELMERRMTELLEELNASTEHLTEFNGQLAQFPLDSMLIALEAARTELGPTLEQMKGVSWAEISHAVSQGLEWYDRLDTEKIASLLGPFIQDDAPPMVVLDDPFNEVQIDFFPPPPPRRRG